MESLSATARKAPVGKMVTLDVADLGVRHINQYLHHDVPALAVPRVEISTPNGAHNVAVGIDADVHVDVLGHAGYYAAGMNQRARVTIHGNVERGVAENMMSGVVRVTGNASECAGATAHGGLLVIEGDASSRCGISLKGGSIAVKGSVGHASAFMAQAGLLLVGGDAGPALGDSLYEAVIYVRGVIEGLGADAQVEPVTAQDLVAIGKLLEAADFPFKPTEFKRVGSARTLYHWNAAHHQEY